jgi:hypothetical protein
MTLTLKKNPLRLVQDLNLTIGDKECKKLTAGVNKLKVPTSILLKTISVETTNLILWVLIVKLVQRKTSINF